MDRIRYFFCASSPVAVLVSIMLRTIETLRCRSVSKEEQGSW